MLLRKVTRSIDPGNALLTYIAANTRPAQRLLPSLLPSKRSCSAHPAPFPGLRARDRAIPKSSITSVWRMKELQRYHSYFRATTACLSIACSPSSSSSVIHATSPSTLHASSSPAHMGTTSLSPNLYEAGICCAFFTCQSHSTEGVQRHTHERKRRARWAYC